MLLRASCSLGSCAALSRIKFLLSGCTSIQKVGSLAMLLDAHALLFEVTSRLKLHALLQLLRSVCDLEGFGFCVVRTSVASSSVSPYT